MSQILAADFPIDPTTTSGTALSQVLNRFADAEHTNNSGATAPPNTTPGMFWLDTSSGANGVLKMRDSPNTGWLPVFNSALPPVTPAGGTFTGNLTISNADPALILNRNAGATAHIARLLGQVGGLARWDLILGEGTAEAGANAGSLFQIRRYTDAGAVIDSPFVIDRATGRVVVAGLGVVSGGTSIAQFGALGLSLTDAVQVGASATATQNLVIRTNKDGTFTMARGNAGATTQDLLTIDAAGVVKARFKVPTFSAYQSAAQSINNGAIIKVLMPNEEYDNASCYDTGLSRYTPNVPGWYWFAGVVSGNFSAGGYTSASVYKNGVGAGAGVINSTAGQYSGMPAFRLVYMNGTTDYAELFMTQNSGGTQTTLPGIDKVHFEGFLVAAD